MGRVSVFVGLWLASSFSLSSLSLRICGRVLLNGSGLLFAGRLADLFGRKWLYLGGLTTFCIFSIISAVIKVSYDDHT